MLVRRLGLAVPLAFLVAVLVHLALFGAEHAPGAEHSEALVTALAAGLALAALCTVLFAALRTRRSRGSACGPRYVTLLDLAGGGAVASLANLLGRLLRLSGERLAAYAAAGTLGTHSLFFTAALRTTRARSAAIAGSCRGRAPPLFS